MRKFTTALVMLTTFTAMLMVTGCGKDTPLNDASSTNEGTMTSTTTNANTLDSSKTSLVANLDSLVSNPDFVKKTADAQKTEVQSILNSCVTSGVIKAGTISFDTGTRTFNFVYSDGTNGFYSLNNVKYAINNEDNLVWSGQVPVVTEPQPGIDTPGTPQGGTGSSGDNSTGNDESNVDNSNYIIGVKLNYNNATGFIQGRFITSTGGAYAFDFTDRFTMDELDLIGQLKNILETRTCTYCVDSQTLNELIQLSNNIDYTADLYQTIGDTQQDIISEVIYTYNRKTGLLVECYASGVKESELNDPDAESFAVALIDAIENKIHRKNS